MTTERQNKDWNLSNSTYAYIQKGGIKNDFS